MKTIIFIAALLIFQLGAIDRSFAQISEGGKPLSFIYKISDSIDVREITQLSKAEIQKIVDETDKNGTFYKIGKSIPVRLSIDNCGTWIVLPDGSMIWRLKLVSKDALALGIYYDNFYIPHGGKLFLYNENKTQVIGAFTEQNNPESGLFATELIQGGAVYLEYFQPAKATANAIINISEISYIFRDVQFSKVSNKDFGDASSCNINVNCPEGANWQNEKKGVVRILLTAGGSQGWCSGSLLNNTAHDCTPYILTADHCGSDATSTELMQWIFYFNYDAPGCSNPVSEGTLASQTTVGSFQIANGGDAGTTGSDFFLVQLSNEIPTNYNVYFNGWSKANIAPISGVSIHHPSGDIKKISTYVDPAISAEWNGNGLQSHWRVTWASTTNGYGVTEPGSSGAPLFDSNHRIVGSLTGGMSICSGSTGPDHFGKISYSWQSNGTAQNQQLKPWLDPENTGLTYLDGEYCGAAGYDTSVISGTIFNDLDENGIRDPGENGLASKIISIENINDDYTFYTITDSLGNYNISPGYDYYSISYTPNQYWYFTTDSSSFHVLLSQLNDTVTGLDFGIKAIADITDLSTCITADEARCGWVRNYWLDLKNTGTNNQNGTINFIFDTLLGYISSYPPPDNQTTNLLEWNYYNLDADDQRQIHLTFQVPDFSFMGDTLMSYVSIEPVSGDVNPANNYDTLRQVVVCSYDPNDKAVSPQGYTNHGYTLFGQKLTYTIRFQNTGNAEAYTIEIKDTLDYDFDIESFSLIAASHPIEFEIEGAGVVTFTFNNIMLPDSNTDEPGSNGFVKFSIEPKDSLAENTTIRNTAYIFFDFNPAVVTNGVTNTYVSVLPPLVKIVETESPNDNVMVFPNPFSSTTTIIFPNKEKSNYRLSVYDITGQTVRTMENIKTGRVEFYRQNLSAGLYYFQLTNDCGKIFAGKLICVSQ